MSVKKAVVTFKRAPKLGDTMSLGTDSTRCTVVVRSGMRRPKLPFSTYGHVFVLPPRELACDWVKDMVFLINRNPVKFGYHAVANQWRLVLEPLAEETRVDTVNGVLVKAVKERKADIKKALSR